MLHPDSVHMHVHENLNDENMLFCFAELYAKPLFTCNTIGL
jgi:hypothetical protein